MAEHVSVDYDCCDEDSALVQLIDHAQNSIAEAQKLVSECPPEIEDKLIAAWEPLLHAKAILLGGLMYIHETKRRTADEILAATKEFFDKVWYQRHIDLHFDDNTDEEDIPNEACAAADRIEAKYEGEENLGAYDDFELGMIHGKLAALRWVMGSEWDDLDT